MTIVQYVKVFHLAGICLVDKLSVLDVKKKKNVHKKINTDTRFFLGGGLDFKYSIIKIKNVQISEICFS